MEFNLDLQHRKQWNHEGGFCGACSLQEVGLKFGMYASQKVIRDLGKREILIGPPGELGIGNEHNGEYNGHVAAEGMQFLWEVFPSTEEHDLELFWTWCKKHIQMGHYPIIGWNYKAEHLDYDHIVNLGGFIESSDSWKNDTLIIHDHFNIKVTKYEMEDVLPWVKACPHLPPKGYGMVILGRANRDPREIDFGLKIYHMDWTLCNHEGWNRSEQDVFAMLDFESDKLEANTKYEIQRAYCFSPKVIKENDVVTSPSDKTVGYTVQRFIRKSRRWRMKDEDGKVFKFTSDTLAVWEPAFSFTSSPEDFSWIDPVGFDITQTRVYRCMKVG